MQKPKPSRRPFPQFKDSPRSSALTDGQGKKRTTRGDEVVRLLRRKNGATIDAMVKRFGLKPHSLRAIISVEGRKRALKVELISKAHYRIP